MNGRALLLLFKDLARILGYEPSAPVTPLLAYLLIGHMPPQHTFKSLKARYYLARQVGG